MDTVADLITRIRNAGHAKHEKVDIPSSNLRVGIAAALKDAGYIRTFKVARDGKQGVMRVYLKYTPDGTHMINKIHRVSRPGRRRYVKANEIPQVRSGYGISVLSTNRGVMSGDKAVKENVGGEILLQVW